ncbi:unnamed protein product [Caenorhabditis auriculariae]|uniref:Uncharacterized protein n=1 Tax=Caenorhabditis auriculariae TaxID=2777116 RepID=A0A8S1HJ21_9PELO|nr:unnamed protein product [Caenorhabditis auriculariae]
MMTPIDLNNAFLPTFHRESVVRSLPKVSETNNSNRISVISFVPQLDCTENELSSGSIIPQRGNNENRIVEEEISAKAENEEVFATDSTLLQPSERYVRNMLRKKRRAARRTEKLSEQDRRADNARNSAAYTERNRREIQELEDIIEMRRRKLTEKMSHLKGAYDNAETAFQMLQTEPPRSKHAQLIALLIRKNEEDKNRIFNEPFKPIGSREAEIANIENQIELLKKRRSATGCQKMKGNLSSNISRTKVRLKCLMLYNEIENIEKHIDSVNDKIIRLKELNDQLRETFIRLLVGPSK